MEPSEITTKILSVNDSDVGYFDLDFYEEKIENIESKKLTLVSEEEYQEI